MTRAAFAITGHRLSHPSLRGRADAVQGAITDLFAVMAESPLAIQGLRLNTMLSDGVDQFAARAALRQGWPVKATLPFGTALTCAAMTSSPEDSGASKQALFREAQRAGDPSYCSSNAEIASFFELTRRADVVALSERDEEYTRLWLSDPQRFSNEASQRYALAARSALNESAFVVAIWDRSSPAPVGGTGHTVHEALALRLPVVWIDPAAALNVRLLVAEPEPVPPSSSIHDAVAKLTDQLRIPR